MSTASRALRGRSGAESGFSVRAPVGQAATHSPQLTQVESPMPASRSKAMRAA